DRAGLIPVLVERLGERIRRTYACGDRVGQLLADLFAAAEREEAVLAEAELARHVFQRHSVERAIWVLKRRIVADCLGNGLIGDREPQLLRMRVDGRRADETR